MIRSNPLDRASTSVPCAMRAHGLCARDVPNNAVVRKKESRSFDLNDLERYYCAWAELPFEFSTHLSLSLSCQICQLPGPHVFPTFVELPNSLAANDWRMGREWVFLQAVQSVYIFGTRKFCARRSRCKLKDSLHSSCVRGNQGLVRESSLPQLELPRVLWHRHPRETTAIT